MMKQIYLIPVIFLGACGDAGSQDIPDFSAAEAVFADQCASCHGGDLKGGQAASLVDDVWLGDGTRDSIGESIRNGVESAGMPPFGEALSEEEILALTDYILSRPDIEPTAAIDEVPSVEDQVQVEDYVTGLDEPWGFAFLGPDNLLVTEKTGRFLRAGPGSEPIVIENAPAVNSNGQGGLLDVALDPEYSENGWIYLTYSHALKGTSGKSMTRLVRGRIVDDIWTDQQVLFAADPKHYIDARYHYGSRITFDGDGHIYFSIGDRGKKEMAQDISRPNGKVHRLNRYGSVPETNPFAGDPDAYPSIYAYGIRNPQGLIIHPETGVLWETEHGPKGGDELNAINAGANYGWPVISYGINYNGTELTPYQTMPGMQQPVSQWTPSIAVCGLDVYTGDLFPKWKGRLMAGALKYQTVRLIDVDGDQYRGEATLIKDQGRVRDVTTGPDGAIYVALPDRIVRISPAP